MYQATSPTYTYTAATPAAPDYRLAGRQVTRELYEVARRGKQAGRRVALVTLTLHDDETATPPGVCVNCLGAGQLGVEVFIAGPFRDVPAGKGNEGGGVVRPVWHSAAWWQVTRHFAPCPVCGQRVVEL